MPEYVPIRMFVRTEFKTVDLDRVRDAINYEYADQGIDARCRKVKKVRGPHEDVFVVYNDVVAEVASPAVIDPVTAAAITAIVIGALGLVAVAYLWWSQSQLRNLIPEVHPYEDLKEFIYDVLDHLPHRDVPSMIAYLEKNHPEWYPGKSFCDVCGMAFDSRERMRAHRVACPDIEPIGPGPGIIPKPEHWSPGQIISQIVNYFRKLLGRA